LITKNLSNDEIRSVYKPSRLKKKIYRYSKHISYANYSMLNQIEIS